MPTTMNLIDPKDLAAMAESVTADDRPAIVEAIRAVGLTLAVVAVLCAAVGMTNSCLNSSIAMETCCRGCNLGGALALFLSGLAVVFSYARAGRQRSNQWLSIATGALVALAGVVSAVNPARAVLIGALEKCSDASIETLIPSDPGTIAGLVVLGFCLMLSRTSSLPGLYVCQALCLFMSCVFMVGVIGHTYVFPDLYHFGNGAGTSFLNCTGFLMMFVCLFLFTAPSGFARLLAGKTSGGMALRRLGLFCLVPPFIGLESGFQQSFQDLLVLSLLLSFGLPVIVWIIARSLDRADKALLGERTMHQIAANIVKDSSQAITIQTLDHIIVSWNSGAELLYGYQSAEAVGQDASTVMGLVDSAELESISRQILAKQTVQNVEGIRARKDGTQIPVELSCSPVRDSQGRIWGLAFFEQDISARKEAAKHVNEFYSIVSHELRTPVTSILGALKLLEYGLVKEEERQEMLNVAVASSDRLLHLINDLLDLKKMESGMMEMRTELIETSELVNFAVQSVEGMAAEAGIKLELELQSEAYVFVDPSRITQVIGNLVSNAIKFSPRSNRVRLVAQRSSADHLRISVVDQGIGIRSEDISKLFQKFKQVDSSDSRGYNGTGLGLAVCKAIVEQHNGRIGVQSKPGEGSTFWFELPIAASVQETRPIARALACSLQGC